MSGDFTLTADIRLVGPSGNLYRKACLVIRQSLQPVRFMRMSPFMAAA